MKHHNVLQLQDLPRSNDTFGNLHELPFTPKFAIKRNELEIKEILKVSAWADMEYRKYPKRTTLVSNLLHDREAVMLYSPTGVGKTWLFCYSIDCGRKREDGVAGLGEPRSTNRLLCRW